MAVVRIPLLAVDGGGTKCVAVLADRAARAVGRGRAGACNYQGIGEEAAARELVEAIRQAMEDAAGRGALLPFVFGQGAGEREWEVDCAVFGIAGLDTEQDRRVISRMVSKGLDQLGIRVRHLIVENDGFAALLGATGGKPGILVIAGTGSIAFGVNEAQKTARAGGWGHRVGDEGSGYWIGRQAIMAVLRAADGRGAPTLLKELLLSHVGLAHVEELFNWTYSERYSVEKVGELSPLVSRAALAGDQVAANILQVAGDELFSAVRAVIDALDMKQKPFQMVLQGGVLQNDGRVRQIVVEHVQRYASQAVIANGQSDPINGVLAKGLAYLERQSGSK
ncbi:N-acetylglucosamine kinase [Brevibacillus sp. SAFN-007a]|uniref:N-acetylglucosamine kinase n=1 Tax=Brevibacillus sp. SAFN-007a TaxID=3436862 RepID=UPI003F80940F